MKITLGEEVVISRAPKEIDAWGPWQFPVLYSCKGKLYAEFHVANDSAKDYSVPKKRFVSADGGESWVETSEFCGLELENGEMVRPHVAPSIPEADLVLPEMIGTFTNYRLEYKVYDLAEVDERYRKWYLDRYSPSTDTVSREEIRVIIPDGVLWVVEGVLPPNFMWSIKHGCDGGIWAPLYRMDNRLGYFDTLYLRSDDDGRSFETVGKIRYEPPYANDPRSSERLGFTEPSIQFVDERNGFSILRVTDVIGVGPSYISYTKDGGRSWSRPEVFDDRGVLPQSVRLDNGVVLAGYGRPGLFVRPYLDGQWGRRVAVVEPEGIQSETCSYCAIEPIGPDTALIVYSRFKYPDEKGVQRKTILGRTIKVE